MEVVAVIKDSKIYCSSLKPERCMRYGLKQIYNPVPNSEPDMLDLDQAF
jgi:hypothetical protein